MARRKHKRKSHKGKVCEGLDPKRVGLALGIVSSIYMLFLGLVAGFFGWGAALVRLIGSLYIGYDVTFKGLIIGMVWVFIDCFIAGYIFAWFYNKIGGCCSK